MEGIDFFVKLRNICDDIVNAYESKDEAEIENALGHFMLLIIQMNALK